jgi:hypothetical protein
MAQRRQQRFTQQPSLHRYLVDLLYPACIASCALKIQSFDARARLLLGLPQIIICLHVQPCLGAATQCISQAQGHVRADCGPGHRGRI